MPAGACLEPVGSQRWAALLVTDYGHVTIQVGNGITDLWENSALPRFPGNITLDGSSGNSKARLVKGGSYSGGGLVIRSGAKTVTIRHLRIEGFSGAGISAFSTPDGGLKDAAFTDLEIHDNGQEGILISSYTQVWASAILIGGPTLAERNLIYANGGDGILIVASTQSNWISSISIRGNGGNGIFLNNATDVTVGGPDSNSRNLIYFNSGDGIKIAGNSWGNTVANNFVGIEATAPNPDGGNHGSGITLLDGVSYTYIQNNMVTGNDGVAGIYVSGVGTDHNSIRNNIVGATIDPASGNLGDGILIADGAW